MIPWVSTARERERVEAEVSAVQGDGIVEVHYLAPSTSPIAARRHFLGFDIADMGLEILTRSGVMWQCRWRMRGFDEGLVFGVPDVDIGEQSSLKRLNVSLTPEWARVLEKTIRVVGLAWHRPSNEAMEAVWAVRLGFEASCAITIALGEAVAPTYVPQYIPDSVVVIFDEDIARAYEPLASEGSAWGRVIATKEP